MTRDEAILRIGHLVKVRNEGGGQHWHEARLQSVDGNTATVTSGKAKRRVPISDLKAWASRDAGWLTVNLDARADQKADEVFDANVRRLERTIAGGGRITGVVPGKNGLSVLVERSIVEQPGVIIPAGRPPRQSEPTPVDLTDREAVNERLGIPPAVSEAPPAPPAAEPAAEPGGPEAAPEAPRDPDEARLEEEGRRERELFEEEAAAGAAPAEPAAPGEDAETTDWVVFDIDTREVWSGNYWQFRGLDGVDHWMRFRPSWRAQKSRGQLVGQAGHHRARRLFVESFERVLDLLTDPRHTAAVAPPAPANEYEPDPVPAAPPPPPAAPAPSSLDGMLAELRAAQEAEVAARLAHMEAEGRVARAKAALADVRRLLEEAGV